MIVIIIIIIIGHVFHGQTTNPPTTGTCSDSWAVPRVQQPVL